MNSSENGTCWRCGAVVPPTQTETLCPACLMSLAMNSAGDEHETESKTTIESRLRNGLLDYPYEFGGYRLLALLGRGGMGTVYEAEELSTGRRVALKMLGKQLDSPDVRKRFLREGRIAAGVNHPNSLYIFGSEEIDGLPVITMEIAGRGTLKDKLKKQGPLPVAEAVDAVLDVISGLESALAGGVLHRDIKPSNCFVCPDGSVKVGDFGLSVSTLSKTDTFVTAHGQIMGTPAYAAPEQLRGDTLDLRADIYSVGATLFTLLTNRAPFEGDNAVQVVANAVNKKPKPLAELREDIPPGLERAVARCLAKEPGARFSDYPALRNVLLPFSSKEPEPASMKLRAQAGWIDYLIAFLPPYVAIMLLVGGEEFHLGFILERTLYSARYYIAMLSIGFLYFGIVEGIWGAGVGKRLKGIRVVRTNGRPPGIARALIRIIIPILSIEGVRIPLLMVSISATNVNDMTSANVVLFIVATFACPWIPVLLQMRARPGNRFATLWDIASRTRVVMKPTGTVRPSIKLESQPDVTVETAESIGPYELTDEIISGQWVLATDPALRRQVWLIRRTSSELSLARRDLARPGRLRWLQTVEKDETTWDAFEATPGVPFSSLIEGGKSVPWGTLRHWLHDLASELWAASGDYTLPTKLSLDHVWITEQGRAVLLDEHWPDVKAPTECIPIDNLAGQQRFLNAVAASVESTSLPLHARPVLQNLEHGKFEKLSFITGILRGLLDKPAEVSKGIRGASIFMLPLYIWILCFVGFYRAEGPLVDAIGGSGAWLAMNLVWLILIGSALIQLFEVPLHTTVSHTTFRLAVVNAKGERAGVSQLLVRWAIVWLPLFVPMSLVILWFNWAQDTTAFVFALVLLILWLSVTASAIIRPHRGIHDRLAGTWVVRR